MYIYIYIYIYIYLYIWAQGYKGSPGISHMPKNAKCHLGAPCARRDRKPAPLKPGFVTIEIVAMVLISRGIQCCKFPIAVWNWKLR